LAAEPAIAAAVLAAGRGARLGGDAPAPKPLLSFRGQPLVRYALDAAIASGLAPVVLVVGHEADAVAAVAPPGVEVARNVRWADGIASSMQAAVRALEGRSEIVGVVVGLADQPLVGAEAWRRVASGARSSGDIVVATYGGQRGNPVLLTRSVWAAALELQGDEGARQLFGTRTVVEISCDGTGTPDDVDTLEDLEAIERNS
jgi:CTP:molybdopterin cytidylyltransferase MocA